MHHTSVTLNPAWTAWGAEALPSQQIVLFCPAKGVLEREKLMELVLGKCRGGLLVHVPLPSPAWGWMVAGALLGRGPSHKHGPGVGDACSSLASCNV